MTFKKMFISDLISDISMGPFGSNIKVECFVEEGIPVLNGSNLEGIVLNEESFRFVTEEKADSLSKANAHKGDVVITHRGTLGQIIFIPDNAKYDRYVISQSQFRLTCNEKILPEYLVYYFHTRLGQYKLLSNASQVGVPALARPTSTFQKLSIEVPDINSQRKIVYLLESIRKKIEINKAINKNLEELAQSLFKSWFIDCSQWKGQVPSSWTDGQLGNFVDIKRGGSPRPIQDYLTGSGLRWLKISDVTSIQSPFVIDIKDHIIEEGLNKTVFLREGSLVLSNSATPGIPKILDVDSCIHDGWLYFPKSKFSKEYLYLYFKEIRNHLINLGNGSVFNNLKTDILKSYPTVLPDEITLYKFDDIVKPIFENIRILNRESYKLSNIKETLLPRLMSGEIDVSNLNI
ncbi:restriction endonuclease subunit S [Succinivibrio sp.]|uniref:restriction endonuclease subunit S n=1 Tax=Succinivibrio sp. TaxID=2053619 RepID=UPI0025ED252E|nr:restriction endonuclease subunit S [Succinivibrio sp.]MBQ9221496.1 restriction endonuclease subunit S [Succinivibrio sp.]